MCDSVSLRHFFNCLEDEEHEIIPENCFINPNLPASSPPADVEALGEGVSVACKNPLYSPQSSGADNLVSPIRSSQSELQINEQKMQIPDPQATAANDENAPGLPLTRSVSASHQDYQQEVGSRSYIEMVFDFFKCKIRKKRSISSSQASDRKPEKYSYLAKFKQMRFPW